MESQEVNVSISEHCARCGGSVELLCFVDHRDEIGEDGYTCPFCGELNLCPMAGRGETTSSQATYKKRGRACSTQPL